MLNESKVRSTFFRSASSSWIVAAADAFPVCFFVFVQFYRIIFLFACIIPIRSEENIYFCIYKINARIISLIHL